MNPRKKTDEEVAEEIARRLQGNYTRIEIPDPYHPGRFIEVDAILPGTETASLWDEDDE